MFRNNLEVPNKIWKDKRIKKESKIIYSIIYSKCYNQTVIHLNVGDIQQDIKIKNKALRKHFDNLKVLNYIDVKEYATGLYMIHLLRYLIKTLNKIGTVRCEAYISTFSIRYIE